MVKSFSDPSDTPKYLGRIRPRRPVLTMRLSITIVALAAAVATPSTAFQIQHRAPVASVRAPHASAVRKPERPRSACRWKPWQRSPRERDGIHSSGDIQSGQEYRRSRSAEFARR